MSSSTLSISDQYVVSPDAFLITNNMSDNLQRSSADGLLTNNQTNLAIKGIIAIKAMSEMSSIVRQTADADKYSVREPSYMLASEIDLSTEYSGESLCSMERSCTCKRSTPPCGIRTDRLVDIRLQFICRYMARHRRRGIICWYLLFLPRVENDPSSSLFLGLRWSQ